MEIDFNQLEKELQEKGRIDHLDNGVTIISENIPGFSLATGNIEITAGSYHEEPQDKGVMHFLEHMSFNGSRNYPYPEERNRKANTLGLHLNAATELFQINFPIKGENQTGYLLQEHFPEACALITDQVFFPTLNPLLAEKEKKIIQRERANKQYTKESNPYSKISGAIKERVYGNNKFLVRDEGLGTETNIESITAETLRRYHDHFFVGENTIVSVGGDINKGTDVCKFIRGMLDKIPQGTRASPITNTPEEPYKGTEMMRLVSPVSGEALVEIYFQTPGGYYDDFFAVQTMHQVLGCFPCGILVQKLREERGLVYSISCTREGHRKTEFVKIGYSIKPDQVEESLQGIDAALDILRSGEFHADTVDAVKARCLPEIVNTFKNPGWAYQEMHFRYTAERNGFEWGNGFDNIRRMLAVTKEDIIRVANRYLTEDRLVAVVAPE